MDNFIDIFHRYCIASIAVLCLSNGIILFLRSKNNKAIRTLAHIILLWGLVYLYRTVAFYVNIFPESYSLLRANVLTTGIIYTFITVLIPMQVLIPGWLNLKRLTYLFLPIIAIAGGYYLGMHLLGEEVEELVSYQQLFGALGHFNVWYRFVILFCNLLYVLGVLLWLYRFKKRYLAWRNDNFSDRDDTDISWLEAYNIILALIFLCYMLVEFIGGKIPVIIHSIVVIISFSYMFYKGLYYRSPYPEDCFSTAADENVEMEMERKEMLMPVDHISDISETSFESKIPAYMETFKHWMDTEKPYLYKDFKLTDVSRALPLNRSYLSRVFNEGYGQNFNEVVRNYRVEFSKEIILKDPKVPMHQVANLSGFNSVTTFIKAFKLVTGITPSQFKTENQE